MNRLILILGFAMALAGCSLPTTTIRSADNRPSISIAGAPDDATLKVDGVVVGKAVDYDGDPQVLLLEPGTHRITVEQGGAVVYDQLIFVNSESKRINVR